MRPFPILFLIQILAIVFPSPAISQSTEFPIEGGLSAEQVNRYYPGILDTVQQRGSAGAEVIQLPVSHPVVMVSILHNTGAFDQQFLCTHDPSGNLIDAMYIGKARDFDETSHTIEFHPEGENGLRFHQVDWGYVQRAGEWEIDTLNYTTYVLKIGKSGNIMRK